MTPAPAHGSAVLDVHRIGGGAVDNLRLKPREAALAVPGISVIRCDSPQDAADQMRAAFPRARDLHAAAGTVGSTSDELIRAAGFDIIHVPSGTLPNHYRITHPDGGRRVRRRELGEAVRSVHRHDRALTMSLQTVRLIDPARNLVAVATVAEAADRFEGTIDLARTPPAARAVFEEFEEVVNGQMFSFLDEVEAKVAALGLTAVFPDGASTPVTRLQVYPGTGDVSFAAAVPAAREAP